MAQLEIACFNLNSAIIAQKNGVNRVELCAGFEVGGTTPKKKEVVEFIKLLYKGTFFKINISTN